MIKTIGDYEKYISPSLGHGVNKNEPKTYGKFVKNLGKISRAKFYRIISSFGKEGYIDNQAVIKAINNKVLALNKAIKEGNPNPSEWIHLEREIENIKNKVLESEPHDGQVLMLNLTLQELKTLKNEARGANESIMLKKIETYQQTVNELEKSVKNLIFEALKLSYHPGPSTMKEGSSEIDKEDWKSITKNSYIYTCSHYWNRQALKQIYFANYQELPASHIKDNLKKAIDLVEWPLQHGNAAPYNPTPPIKISETIQREIDLIREKMDFL